MLYTVVEARANADHTVTITWSDGVTASVDLKPYVTRGGVMAPLQDMTFFREKMAILDRGLGITWPGEIDFSADGLRYDAFPAQYAEDFGEQAAE